MDPRERETLIVVGIALLVAVILVVVDLIVLSNLRKKQKEDYAKILLEANEKAKSIELEARDKAMKKLQESEQEANRTRVELSHEEERMQKRRADLDARLERLEQREQNLNKRQSVIDKRANEVEKLYEQQMSELQKIGDLTMDQARERVLAGAEKEARNDMARIIRQIEAEARQEGERRARDLITGAIQRVASEHVAEVVTSIVTLPNDEMKGRIVGRNGRNIRAFEQAAGVDIIVDDTPEAVTVSCFDPIRREVARRSLERLIQDGRIHPAYIEKYSPKSSAKLIATLLRPVSKRHLKPVLPGCTPRSSRRSVGCAFAPPMGRTSLPMQSRPPSCRPCWQPNWVPISRLPSLAACCTT